jgi:hypothetical protein
VPRAATGEFAGGFSFDGKTVKTYTQAQVDASLAANPNASKGGYEGTTPMRSDASGVPITDPTNPNFVPGDLGSFLNIYGLPTDVQSKVNQIFANTADVNQATSLAMAYIRGTPWYAQTYPGIQEGIAKGVINDESGYRNYLNQVNGLTQQYQGRQVGSDELAGYLQNGYSPTHVGQLYAGKAYVNANQNDIQQAAGAMDSQGQFTGTELTALGNENAGLDSELGQRIQNRFNIAKQRIQTAFSGSLATPGLSTSGGRLQATSLGGNTTPDVGA